MVRRIFRIGVCQLLLVSAAASLADPAQEPLLNRPRPVPPNLMLLLDNSASMNYDMVYEYGNVTTAGYQGPIGGGAIRPIWSYYGGTSPDINKIAYDPRVRYERRVTTFGQPLANPGADKTSWTVFFSRTGNGPYVSGNNRFDWPDAYHTPAYVPPAAEVVPGSTASYPNEINTATLPAGTLFPRFRNRTDCKQIATACTLAEERANYSNWAYWHRNRIQLVKTALAKALSEVDDDVVRIGLASFTELTANANNVPHVSRGVSSLNGATRTAFDSWLASLPTTGDTPSRSSLYRVGSYFQRKDSDGPWATVPNPASTSLVDVIASGPGASESQTAHASCRRSYVMMFTDGYWNDGESGFDPNARPVVNNVDGAGFEVVREGGSKYVYTPVAPYADLASNTLADVSMHFWSRDLRPDLPNRVPPMPRPSNPSTWQNLSFYSVALGVRGTFPQTSETLAELASGTRSWPIPQANDVTTVDDLWHASVNGRGEFIAAKSSADVTAAFRRILNNVSGTPQTLSGVAVSSAYLRAGTRKYKPQYIPGEWGGLLSAIELDPATGNEKNPPLVHWQVESGPSPTGDPVSTIPAHAIRNVVTWNGTQGVNFTAASSGLDAALVNFVRGDAAREQRNGGTFRNRNYRLGDIVNSNPVFIKDGIDLKYERLQGSFGDYRAFVAQKAARPEGVVFVGANDGMLHGFRDGNGSETFAYVPRSVYPTLDRLTQDPYVHRYFVDGPLGETDAYLGNAWKNVLLGTTGSGAKSVFAVDVTAPLTMGPSNVLWEVSASTQDFGNLGYVTGDVQAGITPSNHWVAVFGNGVDSSSGTASLFVVNLANGQRIREISVPASGGNGLGGIRAVYNDARRLVGVYGGDLKGNLWRFDLSSPNPGDWQVGLSGQPLFAAGDGHPITAAPAVVPHPKGGSMVVFGTGKLLESGDTQKPYVAQRAYGIWDPVPFGAAGGGTVALSQLVKQVISPIQIGTPPVTYYQITNNPVLYTGGPDTHRGWYVDLDSGEGQRVIYPVERISSGFVLLSTMSPESANPPDVCTPTGSGSGWVYLMNALTGSGPERPAFDTTLDGTISAMDIVVAGYRDNVDGRPAGIDIGSTASRDRLCVETADSLCTQIELSCGQAGAPACPSGVPTGLKSRQWRQIFPR